MLSVILLLDRGSEICSFDRAISCKWPCRGASRRAAPSVWGKNGTTMLSHDVAMKPITDRTGFCDTFLLMNS